MWLTTELEFTDGLVLPPGCRVEEFDVLRSGDQFANGDIEAARSCAARNNLDANGERSTRKLTFIASVHGHLRILSRLQTTDTQPPVEREPFFRRPSHDERWAAASSHRPGPEASQPAPADVVRDDAATDAGKDVRRSENDLAPADLVRSDNAAVALAPNVPVHGPQLPGGTSPPGPVTNSELGTRNSEPQERKPQRSLGGIVAVIDFMNLLVRAFHAGPLSKINGVRSMFETIGNLIDRICPEFVVFALDGGHAERTRLHTGYKANRPPKPIELELQVKLAETAINAVGWPAILVPGWEADDVAASFAAQFDDLVAMVVLVSSDKDILQACATTRARAYHPWGEGLHLNEQRCVEKYGVGFAQMRDYLALCGCASDNVPGVPGVGEKTAAELLKQHGNLDRILDLARCDVLKGKGAKALKEHADAARLSRELVTLRTDLPIGEAWTEWPIHEPRAGWKQRLIDLGLASTANRLALRLPPGRDRGERSSVHVSQAVPSVAVVPSSPSKLSEEISDANRKAAIEVYNHAATARAEHGKPCAAGYHAGTLLRAAWDAGSDGLPFESIDLSKFGQFGRPIAVADAASISVPSSPETSRKGGSLF